MIDSVPSPNIGDVSLPDPYRRLMQLQVHVGFKSE